MDLPVYLMEHLFNFIDSLAKSIYKSTRLNFLFFYHHTISINTIYIKKSIDNLGNRSLYNYRLYITTR
jgi:hypothetical protein